MTLLNYNLQNKRFILEILCKKMLPALTQLQRKLLYKVDRVGDWYYLSPVYSKSG